VVKRGFLVTVCGAAVVIAGLSGCSSDKKSSSATTSAGATTTSAAATASATAAPGAVKVVIDGQEQNVQGTVVCTSMGGNMNIAIGDGGTGIAAVLSEADPPTVTSVALGNINGVNLGYTAGVPGGSAEATKDGKTYTIKGTATGMDMANPMQPVTKPFELTVTCP
jgi:lipoprotein LpqH